MTNDELIALLEQEERGCISSTSGALAEQRREALQYYYGQPYGNEIEGRSQVVTTEVKDAVEGIMPSLMAIFTSSEEIVRFEPQGQEDEQAAQQATEYINYLFTRNNNGFLTLYCLFKDALLQKNGYAKVYWEDYTDSGIETYEGLSGDEVAYMLQDPELEMEEGVGEGESYSKVVFRRTKSYGKVCIDPVPPEEVLISKEAPNDLTKARFVEHRTRKTISQIRDMGFEVPDDITDFAPNAEFNEERTERFKFDDADAFRRDSEAPDPSTREVWLCEAYLHVDFDDDGHAEYRKVTKVGKEILDNVEFDSLPVVGGTAIIMPHKHYGLSVHDLLKDIQLNSSTLLRNIFDNTYLLNNERKVVLDGMVNMDDLLQSRPGGIIRAKAMNAVQPLVTTALGAPAYNLLEYLQKIKQNRAGVRDFDSAVDPNALNAKARTAEIVDSSAHERIKLMARIFAETVVKQIFWKILELVSKHQNKPQMVKLRNQWVQVDPREWKNKFNMTVTVGLGTGSQQTLMQGAMGILQMQLELLKAGMANRVVTEKNIYESAKRFAKSVFPKDADSFFSNPDAMPPRQPQPDPEMVKLQLQDKWKEMGDAQKRDKADMDAFLSQLQMKLDADKEQFQAMVKRMSEDKGHEVDLAKEAMKMSQENRQLVMDKLGEIAKAADQSQHEQNKIALQGKIDQVLQTQAEQAKLIEKTMELAAAEREHEVAERDQKGKIKKTVSRVKKKDK